MWKAPGNNNARTKSVLSGTKIREMCRRKWPNLTQSVTNPRGGGIHTQPARPAFQLAVQCWWCTCKQESSCRLCRSGSQRLQAWKKKILFQAGFIQVLTHALFTFMQFASWGALQSLRFILSGQWVSGGKLQYVAPELVGCRFCERRF